MTYTAHEVLGGIYEKTVKMTVDRRLRYAPYSQAGWRDYQVTDGFSGNVLDRCAEFYSYSSLIFTATYDSKGRVICIDTHGAKAAVNCSRTTSAQVTKALRELGMTDGRIYAIKRALAAQTKCGFTQLWIKRGHVVLAATGEVIA